MSFRIHTRLIAVIAIALSSCTKNTFISNNTEITDPPLSTPSSYKTKTLIFKTSEWKAYPYIGGPGEDSMFNYFSPSFDTVQYYKCNHKIKKLNSIFSSEMDKLYIAKR